MRILNWIQNKLNGRQEKKSFEKGSFPSLFTDPPQPEIQNDEFSDWPHGLLAIGTLNRASLKEEEEKQHHPLVSSQSSNNISDFTIEEVLRLQIELTKLLKNKPKSFINGSETSKEKANLPLNRLLNCPSSLLRISDELEEEEGDNGDLSPDSIIILKKVRDFLLADNGRALRQKSFSFLLKRIFVCKSGFAAASSLRDPILVSKMEKLLRIIVYKKIFSKSSATVAVKRCIENKLCEKVACKDEGEEKEDRRFKWDKTDSDFIVLEI